MIIRQILSALGFQNLIRDNNKKKTTDRVDILEVKRKSISSEKYISSQVIHIAHMIAQEISMN